nr:hypothetical protein [Tanacetum cinerariifolium]
MKLCVSLEAIISFNLGANYWVLQLGTSSGMGEWLRGFSGQVAGRGWGKTCCVDWAGKVSRVTSVLKRLGDMGEGLKVWQQWSMWLVGTNRSLKVYFFAFSASALSGLTLTFPGLTFVDLGL